MITPIGIYPLLFVTQIFQELSPLQLMEEQYHKSLKSFQQQTKNFELNYNFKINVASFP
jgi:hypothetical protein